MSDLGRLLAGLEPKLSQERYAFDAVDVAAMDTGTFALVREEEGVTAIRVSSTGEWARISLGVNSSLDDIGLTAALSRALADAGISANIVAALRHDHVFVPWTRRGEAMAVLQALSAG
jgi:uncharacterized protein